MLPGWCCIAIAALELGNGDSWCHMCAFRFHFWGRKVNWNQASHVRASSVLCILQCTAGLSGTMTSWNVLNSSAVGTFSEPATTRAWSHRIVWLHAICTTEDIFACFSFLRALPIAEEYYWRSSIILQVYISPMKLGPCTAWSAMAVWKFSLACEASCAPLPSAPYWGGTWHSDHHDILAHEEDMIVILFLEVFWTSWSERTLREA